MSFASPQNASPHSKWLERAHKISGRAKLVPALQQLTVGLREAVLVPASLLIAPVAELGKFADFDYKMQLESYRNHIYTRSVETCYYYYLVFL